MSERSPHVNKKLLKISSTLFTIATLSFCQNFVRASDNGVSCPVGQNNQEVGIVSAHAAYLREKANKNAPIITTLPADTKVGVLQRSGGSWDKVKTEECQEGFIADSLIRIEKPQKPNDKPQQEIANNPGDFALIEKALNGRELIRVEKIDPITERLLSVRQDEKFMDALLHMKGFNAHWNGYNSPSPFDDSGYPQNGNWFSRLRLVLGEGVYTDFACWKSDDPKRMEGKLLCFAFKDLKFNADKNGEHNGQHHFEWALVDLKNYERVMAIPLDMR